MSPVLYGSWGGADRYGEPSGPGCSGLGYVPAPLSSSWDSARTVAALADDIGKTRINPGYSLIGRLKGLAELRGIMRAVERFDLA